MKYYFGFVAIIILLFIGAKLIFSSPKKGNTAKTATSSASTASLADLANTNAEVSVTIEGPIIGNEQHRAIRIKVNRDQRTLDILEGYSDLSIQHNTFDNTTDAYKVFLSAIEGDGFTRAQKSLVANDTGVCPTGTKYLYQITNTGNSKTDQRLWSVSCGVTIGSAAANGPAVRDLFMKQIPDFSTLTKDVNVFPPPPQNNSSFLL